MNLDVSPLDLGLSCRGCIKSPERSALSTPADTEIMVSPSGEVPEHTVTQAIVNL